MAVTGYLSEFSLAEIFSFLEQGNKTGLLTICALSEVQPEPKTNFHIWFNQGQIVAAANALDRQGLINMISKRGWLGGHAAARLAQSCTINTPMGLCLKTQGVLNVEQLKMLFYTQVMRQVCALFSLKDGWFQFDGKSPLPPEEMTGLNAPATDVTLAGLRALKDWSALADRLPEPTSALLSIIDGKPQQKLNQTEWQVWEFTKGTQSISAIAAQIQLPTEKTQQIAFRLVVSGLAEEVPLVTASSITSSSLDPVENQGFSQIPSGGEGISQSFLHNLVGFLRGKV